MSSLAYVRESAIALLCKGGRAIPQTRGPQKPEFTVLAKATAEFPEGCSGRVHVNLHVESRSRRVIIPNAALVAQRPGCRPQPQR